VTDRVRIAKIGAAHGLRGEVRLNVYAETPEALPGYGELETADGAKRFRAVSLRPAKGVFIAKFEGVNDRNAAEALTHVELFVARGKLPAIEEAGTFYHTDLIGLRVEDTSGAARGVVVAVQNYGAGDLIEVAAKPGMSGTLVPFIEKFVPLVDLAARRMVIDPPGGLFPDTSAPAKGERQGGNS
jgi:16S rRNA processing protein RimM